MANILYPKGKEALLSAAVNLPSDNIKVVLLSSAYTYSSSHQFLTDVAADVLSTSPNLGSKTITGGVFDAADTTWTAVTTGHTGSYVVGYKDTGTAGTSPLIWIDDTGTNIPISTNGGDIACSFNASGIFAL